MSLVEPGLRLLAWAAKPGRRVVVGTFAFFALVAGCVMVVRPDDAFGPRHDEVEVELSLGDALVVGLEGPSHQVDLTEARPLVSGDAAVRVRALRCRAPTEGAVGIAHVDASAVEIPEMLGPGSTPRDAGTRLSSESPCREMLPAPGPLAPFVPNVGDQLVLVVQPLEPGLVVVRGIAVTHVNGVLHRTERTGPEMRVTVLG